MGPGGGHMTWVPSSESERARRDVERDRSGEMKSATRSPCRDPWLLWMGRHLGAREQIEMCARIRTEKTGAHQASSTRVSGRRCRAR
jgi:hypothetical protein